MSDVPPTSDPMAAAGQDNGQDLFRLSRMDLTVVASSYVKWAESGKKADEQNAVIDEVVKQLVEKDASLVARRPFLREVVSSTFDAMLASKKGQWSGFDVVDKLYHDDIHKQLPTVWAKVYPEKPVPDTWNKYLHIHSMARKIVWDGLSPTQKAECSALAMVWNTVSPPASVLDIEYTRRFTAKLAKFLADIRRDFGVHGSFIWGHVHADGEPSFGCSDTNSSELHLPAWLREMGADKRYEVIQSFAKFYRANYCPDKTTKGSDKNKAPEITKDATGYPIMPDVTGLTSKPLTTVFREFLLAVLHLALPIYRHKTAKVPWGLLLKKEREAFTVDSHFPEGDWIAIFEPSKMGDDHIAVLCKYWHTKQHTDKVNRPVTFSQVIIDQKLGSRGRAEQGRASRSTTAVSRSTTTQPSGATVPEGTAVTMVPASTIQDGDGDDDFFSCITNPPVPRPSTRRRIGSPEMEEGTGSEHVDDGMVAGTDADFDFALELDLGLDSESEDGLPAPEVIDKTQSDKLQAPVVSISVSDTGIQPTQAPAPAPAPHHKPKPTQKRKVDTEEYSDEQAPSSSASKRIRKASNDTAGAKAQRRPEPDSDIDTDSGKDSDVDSGSEAPEPVTPVRTRSQRKADTGKTIRAPASRPTRNANNTGRVTRSQAVPALSTRSRKSKPKRH
ncbi:hypothetical protein CONPUDRAFT_160590 [Coniophora puteana RWD-64-598 SS2]|uniref:Uncharacterized protein n=1 Tax=Coniophora puteana (strain RWD-64-598) TaxID=741705 RepID=R7SDF1_CONPW|nr:uncharacterized protein CONPUDRAFT_160590 [Coniophora puteana RWD-64-598 SS2]EIW73900.1 hypothetical protein CONPUDRAFT_160590 [Coniophora puteana RWD-64-598 SS2]